MSVGKKELVFIWVFISSDNLCLLIKTFVYFSLYHLLMLWGLIEHLAIRFFLSFLFSIPLFFYLYFLFTMCFPSFCSLTSYVFLNVLVFNDYYSIMPLLSGNHRIHSHKAQIHPKNLLHCLPKLSYQLFRFLEENKSHFPSVVISSEPIVFLNFLISRITWSVC